MAAIDIPDVVTPLGLVRENAGQHIPLTRLPALEIHQELLARKRCEDLTQLRHQADTLAAQGIRGAAIVRITMGDVEALEVGEITAARLACAGGAAIERPVVEDGQVSVCRWMDIELDYVSARRECGSHRRHRVLDVRVPWLVDPLGRTRIAFETFPMIGLMHASVRDELNARVRQGRDPPRRVEDIERADQSADREEDETTFAHAALPTAGR